jgi:hypothetical protein
MVGPIEEEDIDTVIEVLRILKGEGTTFQDLTPEERRAFARLYRRRTRERRSGVGGALIVGALVALGGAIWYQSQKSSAPARPKGASSERDFSDSEDEDENQ